MAACVCCVSSDSVWWFHLSGLAPGEPAPPVSNRWSNTKSNNAAPIATFVVPELKPPSYVVMTLRMIPMSKTPMSVPNTDPTPPVAARRTFRCSVTPDTTPEVSHRRAEEPVGARRGSAVSNSAAWVVNRRTADNLTDTKSANAAIPTRSATPASARSTTRSPVGSTAPAQKSERTSPHEGSRIRSTKPREDGERSST